MSAQIPFSVVTKPTGAACNLDCQYCFFLSKELLYDAAAQTMSEQTLERYVEAFLESSPDGEVTMLWQGGEPTLRGLVFFERLVDLCKRYRRPTQSVRHALQTNGTLVTDEWARYPRDGCARLGGSGSRGRGNEHPVHGQCRERGARSAGVSLLP